MHLIKKEAKKEAAKSAAIHKKMKGSDERHFSTKHETAEGQRKNAELRKGMKRPEHGIWPIAK